MMLIDEWRLAFACFDNTTILVGSPLLGYVSSLSAANYNVNYRGRHACWSNDYPFCATDCYQKFALHDHIMLFLGANLVRTCEEMRMTSVP